MTISFQWEVICENYTNFKVHKTVHLKTIIFRIIEKFQETGLVEDETNTVVVIAHNKRIIMIILFHFKFL